MGRWGKEQIGVLANTFAGGTPSRSIPSHFTGNIPWVTSSEVNQHYMVDTREKITVDAYKSSSTKMIPKDAVLVAMYGATAGQVSRLMIEACSNQAVLACVSNQKIVSSFLYYLLGDLKDRIIFRAQGSGQTNLSKEIVDNTYAQYPVSLDEQRHIAEILTTCDEVIEKSEAVVDKYRAIKAGMLKDLFTRGIGKNGKLRPPPESAPQLYKDIALGKVPCEWEVRSFDSAFELHGNNTLSRAFLTDQNGVVRNVHYGDVLVKYDTILDCDDKALPSVITEGVRLAGNDYLQNGDLVFADTAEDDTVGKAVELYNVGDRKIVSGLHTIFARSKENDFASRWLGYYVNSDSFHKQLLPFVVGSKVSSISRTNIKRTFVVIPESDEQQQIAERLSAIDAKIADELAVIAKYRKVKAGLMARLLTPPPGVEIVDGGV
jgi:type I restriction enzyme S subunit